MAEEEVMAMVKAKGIIALAVLVVLFCINYFALDLGAWLSTGLLFTEALILVLVIHFTVKFKNRNNPKAEANAYVLPDSVAKHMKVIDTRVQFEASIMSMFFIMIGMVALTIYVVFFSGFAGLFKFFMAFNSFWGFVFMLSYLVTTFQQYNYHMQSIKQVSENADIMMLPTGVNEGYLQK